MSKVRPLAAFYLLTIVIPAVLVASFFVTPGFWNWLYGEPFNIFSVTQATAEQIGIPAPRGPDLIAYIRLVWAEPILFPYLLYPASPAIAGLLIVMLIKKNGAREWFARWLPWRDMTVQSGLRIWLLLIVSMIAVNAATWLIRDALFTDLDFTWAIKPLEAAFWVLLLQSMLLDQGAVLEEGGWRGFAQPYLQDIGMNPVNAAILVGVLWSFWHIPRDFMTTSRFSDGVEGYLLYLSLFTLQAILLSIIITWFFNRLGGSVLAAVVIHGISNDMVDISGNAALFASGGFTAIFATKSAALAIFAVALIIVSKGQLGIRRDVSESEHDRSALQ